MDGKDELIKQLQEDNKKLKSELLDLRVEMSGLEDDLVIQEGAMADLQRKLFDLSGY